MIRYIEELEALKLPIGEYAIFGSGPLAVRRIRESQDIDIIVKKILWNELTNKHQNALRENPIRIQIGNVAIYNSWLDLTDKMNEMIDRAEIIEGLPFVRLEYVIKWKESMGREKDRNDIELIIDYLKS